MRGAVLPDEAGAIDGEAHGQALQGHVMHDLVEAALQEGGVDGADRRHALARKAGSKRHGVLLGDANIKGSIGKTFREDVKSRARRHGCGDGHELRVAFGGGYETRGEDLGESGRVGFRRLELEGDRIKLCDRVIVFLVRGGEGVATALLGHDMDEHRARFRRVPGALQRDEKRVQVMSVDGTFMV